jgi:hypothetical protein
MQCKSIPEGMRQFLGQVIDVRGTYCEGDTTVKEEKISYAQLKAKRSSYILYLVPSLDRVLLSSPAESSSFDREKGQMHSSSHSSGELLVSVAILSISPPAKRCKRIAMLWRRLR